MIATFMIVGTITVATSFYNPINLQIISPIAHAEVQTYMGVGESIISDRETIDIGKQGAKLQALRNAEEQAGVFIASMSIVKNGNLQKDEIIALTAGIVKIIGDIKYEPIPLGDSLGTIKYRATVVVGIDMEHLNEKLNQWINKAEPERLKITAQNKEINDTIVNIQKLNNELENKIINAKTIENDAEIKADMQAIDRDVLYLQKIEEGNEDRYAGRFGYAIKNYTEAIKLNSNKALAYKLRASAYISNANDIKKNQNLNPDIFSTYKNPVELYNKALADYTKLIELEPKSWNYENRAVLYTTLNQYDEAINDYTTMIQIEPKPWNYKYRAEVYKKLKKYDKAIADLTMAINLIPKDSKIGGAYSEDYKVTAYYSNRANYIKN